MKRRFIEVKRTLRGCAFGLLYPTMLIYFEIEIANTVDWQFVDKFVGVRLAKIESELSFENKLMRRVLAWATYLQASCGIPMFQQPRLLSREKADAKLSGLLAVPYAPGCALVAEKTLEWAFSCASYLTNCDNKNPDLIKSELYISLEVLQKEIALQVPSDANTFAFIEAAHRLSCPWTKVAGDVYQFGWGANAQLMLGSFTNKTSSVGVALARQKFRAAQVLRRLGLPAPLHRLVQTSDDAVKAAVQFGYPVVVKPADKDGGLGVQINLQTEQQVRLAFTAAKAISKSILLEKYTVGNDYRLTVFDGRLVWALQKEPAGIHGDGQNTIAQLIRMKNSDPARAYLPWSTLRPVHLDEEAKAYLDSKRLTLESIPPAGVFVRLKQSSYIASGGTPIPVNDVIHQSNKRLAEDVARAFNLDLLGIDLVTPDITKPWFEVGAVICDVNADPNLGLTAPKSLVDEILNTRCNGNGRLPVAVIIGHSSAQDMLDAIEDIGKAKNITVARISRRDISLGGEDLHSANNLYDNVLSVLSKSILQVAIIRIEALQDVEEGLPIDKIHTLAIAGPLKNSSQKDLERIMRMLGPNSKNILYRQDDRQCQIVPAFDNAKPIYGNAQSFASVTFDLLCTDVDVSSA